MVCNQWRVLRFKEKVGLQDSCSILIILPYIWDKFIPGYK